MKHHIAPQYAPKRAGDARYIIVDIKKPFEGLNWKPGYSLE